MSRASFETFGDLAASGLSDTEKAGRHGIQAKDEKNIVADVIAKLALEADDDLLEIGCGSGNLLIPLSFRVKEAVGIDHVNMIAALDKRFSDPSLSGVPGDFLEIEMDRKFAKILIYSVLHYMSDGDEVFAFIDRAVALLRPGGRLLIGDLPNDDRKRRFNGSDRGKRFNADWQAKMKKGGPGEVASKLFAQMASDDKRVPITDGLVLRILQRYRERGYDAFVVPQPPNLPFCHSREDILISFG